MRRSQSSSEHAEAVSRRLATLSAELAAVRDGSVDSDDPDRTRVRVRPGEEPPVPVVLPVPGRHASRRMQVGGLRLGPVHLAVVTVVAALAVGLAAWWAIRDQAEVVPLGPAAASGSSSSTSSGTSGSPEPLADVSAPPDATGDLVVDVAGKVRRPGIAVLPAGSRVIDALEAAGGARRGVDLTALNLARPIVDGEQILVGVAPAPGVAGTVGSAGSSTPSGSLVNLNTADQAALDTLPGVGPVTADAILSWREENGGFTSVDELLEVDGIGEATLEDIAPLVTI
ncbi:competence protein ComEA [Nocardioides exalbidus]|uniref:Competence protein ComEA n=1 Tax=Nocardioides exalbidus TaxID=402596 RepID=A0A1H4VMQ5_9ACTN|nr:ComEA family DNA-binding protein [Nocardioides exalbidus]SEC82402.1 competence protein ComEA [Nocardioides exalbidus]